MEIVFVVFVALLIATLNQLHVITQWFAQPPNTYFTGIAHYFADYFLYIDTFVQGTSGSLTTIPHFTNEPLNAIWIYWFNALLGFVGNIFGLSPFTTYNLSLFLFVILLVIVWYYVTSIIFPKNRFGRLTSFILILTSSSFFNISLLLSTGDIQLLGQFWFSPTPAFNRLGGVPHQVWQTILFILLTIIVSYILETYEKLNSKKRILLLLLLTFITLLSASANPIQMLVFTASTFIVLLWKAPKSFFTQIIKLKFPIGIVCVGGFIVAFFTNQSFTSPVLTAAKIWELSQQVRLSLSQFLLSVGPIILFIPFALRPLHTHTNTTTKLLISYGMLSIIFFNSPIPKLLGTVNVRYLHPAPYGALAVMATIGLIEVSRLIFELSRKKVPLGVSQIILTVLVLFITIPSLYTQIYDRTNPTKNSILTSDINHIPNSVVDALTWLHNQPNDSPVVLTDPRLPYDVVVPVFSGKITFTGHPLHTLYPRVKDELRNQFFANALGDSGTAQFIKDHRIGYILTIPNWPFPYQFLEKVFQNETIALWKENIN